MIKAVIFDWFGVCSEKLVKVWQRELEKKVDKDVLTESFFRYLDKYANNTLTGEQFLEEVFKEIALSPKKYNYLLKTTGKLNTELLEEILEIKGKYKTAIIASNFKEINPIIEKEIGGFKKYFDEIIFSNELNISKTNKNTYEIALKKLGLEGKECLFIDDKEKNLIVARKFGIRTILYKNNNQLKKELGEYLK
jgi:epoxide hydrolase-like predicted phosphatase